MRNRIREARKANGLNQEQLAKKIHVTSQTISNYETGTREPKGETWSKLAKILNVEVDYLKGYGLSEFDIFKTIFDACLTSWNNLSYISEYREENKTIVSDKNIDKDLIFSAPDVIATYCFFNGVKIPEITDVYFFKRTFKFLLKSPIIGLLQHIPIIVDETDNLTEIIIKEIAYQNLLKRKVVVSSFEEFRWQNIFDQGNIDEIKAELIASTNKAFEIMMERPIDNS